jgi:hypothetical protein
MSERGCTYIGPDQDPRIHIPVQYCGAQCLSGKNYCKDHYWVVYQKDSSRGGKRKQKELAREADFLAKLEREVLDIDESLV